MTDKKDFKQIYATPELVVKLKIIAATRDTSLRAIVDEAFEYYLNEKGNESNGK